MRLRLKSQMAGFLFLLFGTAILLITYFNVSLLGQSIRAQAEQESLAVALQVGTWVREVVPDGGFSRRYLGHQRMGPAPLEGYLRNVSNLRVLKIFDLQRREIYRFGDEPGETTLEEGLVPQVLRTRQSAWRLLNHTQTGGISPGPWLSLNPFHRGFLTFEYFRPIRARDSGGRETGSVQAALYLSLDAPLFVRRLQFVALGNTVLAILFVITAFIAIQLWGEHAVNRPLENLLRAQEQLGRGDYSVHVGVEIPSANEVILLTNSFNRMARELSQFQRALEDKSQRLEQMNEQYRQLNEQLEQQVEDKTRDLREFFSLVTHDLRIPLAAVQGYAELLGRGSLSERQARYLRNLTTANAHLQELVRNLLDAVRFDAGQVQLLPERFVFRDLAREVLAQLGTPEIEAPEAVRLQIEPEGLELTADRTRIGRVLTNLLSNALRFSPPGVPVLLGARELAEGVEVRVSDQGPGIPEDRIPLLFEKFRHFPTREGPSSGLGLGLYIVRRVLESHGVRVRVESRLGVGTTFSFCLPAEVVAGLAAPGPAGSPAGGR